MTWERDKECKPEPGDVLRIVGAYIITFGGLYLLMGPADCSCTMQRLIRLGQVQQNCEKACMYCKDLGDCDKLKNHRLDNKSLDYKCLCEEFIEKE